MLLYCLLPCLHYLATGIDAARGIKCYLIHCIIVIAFKPVTSNSFFSSRFPTKTVCAFSLPCGCIMWSLCHHCLKSWQLLKCKAFSVLCLWISSMLEKYVWYHILFISKVDWMISKCHSMSCFLPYTEFHTWVETCCREWVSFGSLLC